MVLFEAERSAEPPQNDGTWAEICWIACWLDTRLAWLESKLKALRSTFTGWLAKAFLYSAANSG